MDGSITPERDSPQTSQQQNEDLNRLISLLPQSTRITESDDPKEVAGKMDKRAKSEYVNGLMIRADGIIQKAPITGGFKDFIMERLKLVTELGVYQEEEHLRDELFFLDRGTSYNGIFDKERAKHLERVAVARKVLETLRTEEIVSRATKITSGNTKPVVNDEGRAAIQLWKQEFKTFYGEDL